MNSDFNPCNKLNDLVVSYVCLIEKYNGKVYSHIQNYQVINFTFFLTLPTPRVCFITNFRESYILVVEIVISIFHISIRIMFIYIVCCR